MRIKDDEKKKALFEATVKIVNETGFANSSVSKIAKEAGISPATIYIYHKNKEDLIVSTYVAIKVSLSQATLKDFDDELPIRDILHRVWVNLFDYVSNNSQYHQFIEQFSNSPYTSLIHEELDQHFGPIAKVLQRGIEQKVLKNVSPHLFKAFFWFPLTALANPRLSGNLELTSEDLETAFSMAWDAIRL